MIRCNLSVLLAERNLKITDVSKATGISRTTLTALSSNSSQGIQFDTFNTLCSYLKVTPNQLFTFIPFTIKCSTVDFYNTDNNFKYCIITLSVNDNLRTFNIYLDASIECGYGEDNELSSIDIDTSLQTSGNSVEDIERENALVLKYLKMLPTSFKNDLANEIIAKVNHEITPNITHSLISIFRYPPELYKD